MNIDIDQLTEPELIELNHKIVERLKLLESMRAHGEMLAFTITQRETRRECHCNAPKEVGHPDVGACIGLTFPVSVGPALA